MYLSIIQNGIAPGTEVILSNQTWSNYEALLESRQDNAAIKIYFDAKEQEIRLVSPLLKHKNQSDVISDLVKCLLRYQEQDWEGFHPITFKRFEKKGLEPDFCFYIQNRLAILGKKEFDLEIDPPPDLAIEIAVTSSTKPKNYDEIGFPELWIYKEQGLGIFLFDGQTYQESDRSPISPKFPVKELIPEYVDRAWSTGSSVAVREFEVYLRSLS